MSGLFGSPLLAVGIGLVLEYLLPTPVAFDHRNLDDLDKNWRRANMLVSHGRFLRSNDVSAAWSKPSICSGEMVEFLLM